MYIVLEKSTEASAPLPDIKGLLLRFVGQSGVRILSPQPLDYPALCALLEHAAADMKHMRCSRIIRLGDITLVCPGMWQQIDGRFRCNLCHEKSDEVVLRQLAEKLDKLLALRSKQSSV